MHDTGRGDREDRLRPLILPLLIGAVAMIAERTWAYGLLGIRPHGSIATEWQMLPLDTLTSGLWTAVYDLHSQPPLWNVLVGLFAKLCAADAACTGDAVFALNIGLGFALLALLTLTGWRLGLPRWWALAAALLLCLGPGALYYEPYVYYAQLSALFAASFALGALAWHQEGRFGTLVVASAALVALAWTWSIFHPLLVAATASTLVLPAARRSGLALSIALIAVALSLAPTVKNGLRFGSWANGSWAGLNLALVTPSKIGGCSFDDIFNSRHAENRPGEALNDPAVIPQSKDCSRRAVADIRAHPGAYLLQTAGRVVDSLSLRTADFFFPPTNWDRLPTSPDLEKARLTPTVFVVRGLVLLLNLAGIGCFLGLAVFSTDPPTRRFALTLSVFMLLFLGLAHAFNSVEQQRMRYTIAGLIWIGDVLVARMLWRRATAAP